MFDTVTVTPDSSEIPRNRPRENPQTTAEDDVWHGTRIRPQRPRSPSTHACGLPAAGCGRPARGLCTAWVRFCGGGRTYRIARYDDLRLRDPLSVDGRNLRLNLVSSRHRRHAQPMSTQPQLEGVSPWSMFAVYHRGEDTGRLPQTPPQRAFRRVGLTRRTDLTLGSLRGIMLARMLTLVIRELTDAWLVGA
jgi:hypothetical protein